MPPDSGAAGNSVTDERARVWVITLRGTFQRMHLSLAH